MSEDKSFTNSKGIPPSSRLRCKVGEDHISCAKRLAASGWDVTEGNSSYTEDQDGAILTPK